MATSIDHMTPSTFLLAGGIADHSRLDELGPAAGGGVITRPRTNTKIVALLVLALLLVDRS